MESDIMSPSKRNIERDRDNDKNHHVEPRKQHSEAVAPIVKTIKQQKQSILSLNDSYPVKSFMNVCIDRKMYIKKKKNKSKEVQLQNNLK